MAEFVHLKPRVTIQTVIQFDCPDRASFFAEYSRQLRRGEIFLEVAQKVPVGTRVDVRFQFQDCDTDVELAGEIYRHRRKLDRLEAAVQFLDPEALQRLLRLSEDEIGPLEDEVREGKRRWRHEDAQVESPRAARVASLDDQDTTKLLAMRSLLGPEAVAAKPAAPPPPPPQVEEVEPSVSVPTAWQAALEIAAAEEEEARATMGSLQGEDDLDATKDLPSWGAQWLGLNEGRPKESPAVSDPKNASVPPRASKFPPNAGGLTAEEIVEVENISVSEEDGDAWFDLSEPQVSSLLGNAPPRKTATPHSGTAERSGSTPSKAKKKEEIDSWLNTLTPGRAAPRPGPATPSTKPQARPPAGATPPDSEPETILEMDDDPSSVAVPEPDLDLDDWDWDFLQSPPPLADEPEASIPEASSDKDEAIFADFMRRHVKEPATAADSQADDASDPDAVFFDMSGEEEEDLPAPRPKSAWEELEDPWVKPAASPWEKMVATPEPEPEPENEPVPTFETSPIPIFDAAAAVPPGDPRASGGSTTESPKPVGQAALLSIPELSKKPEDDFPDLESDDLLSDFTPDFAFSKERAPLVPPPKEKSTLTSGLKELDPVVQAPNEFVLTPGKDKTLPPIKETVVSVSKDKSVPFSNEKVVSVPKDKPLPASKDKPLPPSKDKPMSGAASKEALKSPAPLSDELSRLKVDDATTGEWPTEDPFRALPLDPIPPSQAPEDDESGAFEAPRSSWLGRLGVLFVLLILAGGTAAVVLNPGWFSELLGGGDPEPTPLRKRNFTPLVVRDTPVSTQPVEGDSTPQPQETQLPAERPTDGPDPEATPAPTKFEPETIDLEPEKATPAAAVVEPTIEPPTPKPTATPRVQATPTIQPTTSPVPVVAAASPLAAATPAQTPDAAAIVLLRSVQVQPGADQLEIRLATNAKIERIIRSEAFNPPRLIFDLQQTSAKVALGSKVIGNRGVEKIRFGVNPDRIRVVLDVTEPLPVVEVETLEDAVILRVK